MMKFLLTDMANSTAGTTNDRRGEDGALFALPRFVTHSAAVQALKVDVFERSVQNGQFVHVL
jgi:hypothetical protein